jgi:hypothetical protein
MFLSSGSYSTLKFITIRISPRIEEEEFGVASMYGYPKKMAQKVNKLEPSENPQFESYENPQFESSESQHVEQKLLPVPFVLRAERAVRPKKQRPKLHLLLILVSTCSFHVSFSYCRYFPDRPSLFDCFMMSFKNSVYVCRISPL